MDLPRQNEVSYTKSVTMREMLKALLSGGAFRRLQLGGLLLLTAGFAAGQSPGITAIVNAASGLVQGLPNSGIAQGSIFLVTGTNLGPSTLVTAATPFQSTSLEDPTGNSTSVSVTVGSTTVNALMYYTSAGQIAALLPSNTPTGSGTLTVTYAGNASTAAIISVVGNNLGIFTLAQNGQGVAILTYPNYSVVSAIPGTGTLAPCAPSGTCPYTYGGAANPGDTLILWATGLGPSSTDTASSLGQPINVPSSTPLQVWIGGIQATVTYQGRSGCCVGEDQIVFTVPSTVPLGCAVPLGVQIGTLVSNFAAIPVASGSRSCTMQNPAFTSSAIQTLTTNPGNINYAQFNFGRTIASESSNGTQYDDFGQGYFAQVSVGPANQPTVLSSLDVPPFGTCTTFNGNVNATPLFTVNTGIDAGAITISGPFPDQPATLKEFRGTGQATTYGATLSTTGVYFSAGAYTITAAGGTATGGYTDLGAFNTGFTITQTPSWPSSDQARLFNNGDPIPRSSGITINWTGGSPAYWVVISGSGFASAVDTVSGGISASFSCWVPSINNTFNVPASMLLSLPGGGAEAELDFKPTLPPKSFSAPGLDAGTLLFQYQTSFFLTLN